MRRKRMAEVEDGEGEKRTKDKTDFSIKIKNFRS